MATACFRLLAILIGLSRLTGVCADKVAALPDDWFTRVPTPERIQTVQLVANSEGWSPVSARLFSGSLRAYELRQEEAAAAWFLIARWSDLLGQSQANVARRWLAEAGRAGPLDTNIDQAQVDALPDAPLSGLLTPDSITWLLGERDFSAAFFSALSAYDFLPKVIATLHALREADPRTFGAYAQLALAISLVYDSPPPPHWPHWQVSEEALPRRLPTPQAAFKFLVDTDRSGATLHKLQTMSAAELKFVVDFSAAFPELVWAQRAVKFTLPDLAKSYEAVRYRPDRIEAQSYLWPGTRYELPGILKEGGICVDQAYFATQAGKARGVPTLLFSGAGRDGRHAWFGYLGAARKWVLDAGRYTEQRYVTGVAWDPQTWTLLSDHELTFLSEGFRRLPPYQQSWRHQVFADLYLQRGQNIAAAAAARKAVNYERRNLQAWELLVAASAEQPVLKKEALLREAAQTMQRYPDLNARFIRELAASLRQRGEISTAEWEERMLVRRGQAEGRSDLGVDQAAALMEAAKPDEQLRVYKQVLGQYGRAGIDFFDRVTQPLVVQLLEGNRHREASRIVAQTRALLQPETGSQLDLELKELAAMTK